MRFVKREFTGIALMVAFLFVASLSEAAPADPGGAYGLLWGDSPKTASEKIKKLGWRVEKRGKDPFPEITAIMGPNESKIDCTARVETYPAKVRLRFFKDHLFSILVEYKKRDDTRDARLEELFISRYSDTSDDDTSKGMYSETWFVGDTIIHFAKAATPEDRKNYYLFFFYDQISVSRKAQGEWIAYMKKTEEERNKKMRESW